MVMMMRKRPHDFLKEIRDMLYDEGWTEKDVLNLFQLNEMNLYKRGYSRLWRAKEILKMWYGVNEMNERNARLIDEIEHYLEVREKKIEKHVRKQERVRVIAIEQYDYGGIYGIGRAVRVELAGRTMPWGVYLYEDVISRKVRKMGEGYSRLVVEGEDPLMWMHKLEFLRMLSRWKMYGKNVILITRGKIRPWKVAESLIDMVVVEGGERELWEGVRCRVLWAGSKKQEMGI